MLPVVPAAVPLLRPFGVLEDVPALGLVLALVVDPLPVVEGDDPVGELAEGHRIEGRGVEPVLLRTQLTRATGTHSPQSLLP